PGMEEDEQRIGVIGLILPGNEPGLDEAAGGRGLRRWRCIDPVVGHPWEPPNATRRGSTYSTVQSSGRACLLNMPLEEFGPASIATILPPFNKPPSYFQFCLKFPQMRS